MEKVYLEEILYYMGTVTEFSLGKQPPRFFSVYWHLTLEIPFLVSQQQFRLDKQFSLFLASNKIASAYLNICLLDSKILSREHLIHGAGVSY